MEIPKYSFIWTILKVILITVSITDGLKISLFKKKDLSDLSLEVAPTKTCYNIPKEKMAEIRSITTDVCFIAYSDSGCKSPWSSKFEPGDWITTKTSVGYKWPIESIQKCNELLGGPELYVDITTHFENRYPPILPQVLESFNDVCTCKNIPKYVQDMSKWSIDNHGNEVLAYFEPNCQETKSEALWIDGGHWINSRDMHTHIRYSRGATLQIQSFGPVPNSTYFKNSCKAPVKVEPKKEKSNELDADKLEESFKAAATKIETLDSQLEHSKRKLDLCQNNMEKLQTLYSKDMKNITGGIQTLEKDNDEMNENKIVFGNTMLNVTNVIQTLQMQNQNLKKQVRSLEEKAKRAKLEQDMSMEDRFKIQMDQFMYLLSELNGNKKGR